MNLLPNQLRFSLRMLRKNPASSLIAIIAIALGITLTATVFAIMDGIFLRGLPFAEAHELMHLERNDLESGIQSMEVTIHDLTDWQAQQQSFTGLAGFSGGTVNLSDTQLPTRYKGSFISTNFLDILEIQPQLGRGFEAADGEPGAAAVILLSHQVWQKRYGGDPSIIGKTIRANTQPTTVVGVMGPGFHFPINEEVWLPRVDEIHQLQRGEGITLEVFGRLRDGVSIDQAAREMTVIADRLAASYPDTNKGVGAVVQPYLNEFIGDEERSLLSVMFGAVVMVLLIACFNVANLLIGRASLRERELAIRSALGASRLRAVLQVLGEAALISILGTAIGLPLTFFTTRLMDRVIGSTDPPFWFDIKLSPHTLLVVLAATALSALVAGLIPAFRASKPQLNQILQDQSRGSTSLRLGWITRVLVVLEVAFSCGLLVGCVLMVRSVIASSHYDLKMESDNVLTARAGLFEGDHPEETDWLNFFETLPQHLAAQPEVAAAAIGTVIPTDTEIGSGGTNFLRPGEVYDSPREMPFARWTVVSPGYFIALGVNLLAGRDFSLADRDGTPRVAMVNSDFASREWPGESAIGQRVQINIGEDEDPANAWVEVVGVVDTLRMADFDNADDQHGIYVPLAQNPVRFAWVIVNTRLDPLEFVAPLRRTVLEIDPNLPLYFVRSMNQVIDRALFFPNLIGGLFGSFAIVAILLACLGLYGVMSFAVTQRTQEMGVRMALGARSADVLNLVLRQGVKQISIGLVLGLGLGALLAAALASFLFQVQPTDPLTFVLVPLLMLAVGLIACFVPAQRAASVDPLVALRYE